MSLRSTSRPLLDCAGRREGSSRERRADWLAFASPTHALSAALGARGPQLLLSNFWDDILFSN